MEAVDKTKPVAIDLIPSPDRRTVVLILKCADPMPFQDLIGVLGLYLVNAQKAVDSEKTKARILAP